MPATRSISLPYADRFAQARAALPGQKAPWLARLREDAIERFKEKGLPTIRVEEWKYTSLRTLAKTDFSPATAAAVALTEASFPGAFSGDGKSHRLVFVNGRLQPGLSRLDGLPSGVRLLSLAEALERKPDLLEGRLGQIARLNGHALVALNTAFMADGAVLWLKPGTALDEPVHLVFLGAAEGGPIAFHPRILVVAERGSMATLIESHLGAAGDAVYWSNPVVEISLGPEAVLRHYKFQDESLKAFHVAYTEVSLAAGSRYDSFATAVGAGLSRNEIVIRFDGAGSECRLNGVYLLRGRQHGDTTTVIDHLQPRCNSREVYKGVLDGRAHGVFQGRITVHRDAQKSDGHQLNRTLLLSDQARISTKPELEIYADDVKCSHGATSGELADDALFYLRSRGIGEKRARSLLIEAFLSEIVDEIAFEPARDHLRARISNWLAGSKAN